MKVKSIKPFVTSKNRAIGYGNGEVIRIDKDEYDEIKDCVEVVEETRRAVKSGARNVPEYEGPTPGEDSVHTRVGRLDEDVELGEGEE